MYSHCLVCNADLGTNEAIEHFQVGTRLAFDAAKGLLWVVCRGCERWNLTPIEERWEAIEECERFYPVFQFVLWAGKTPQEAISAALIETQGEA